MIRLFTKSLMVFVFFMPVMVPAHEKTKLTAYFQRKISMMRDSLAKLQKSSEDPSMELKTINIEIAPAASFGISSVLNVTVAPEIDFVLVPEVMESD